jgi:diguanylate cyclase (GGDEF)-like protein
MGLVDMLTGSDLSFIIFYIPPIVMAVWLSNIYSGAIIAFLSLSIWIFANFFYPHQIEYSKEIFMIWEIFQKSIFLTITLVTVAKYKELYEKQKKLSYIDYLTGLRNRRSFVDHLKNKVAEFNSEFSICLIDIDKFDEFTAQVGQTNSDETVNYISKYISKQYKNCFKFEENKFALIFNEKTGPTAFSKMTDLHIGLQQSVLLPKKYTFTFSVGIILCSSANITHTQILKHLYRLIQKIKSEGGNDIRFAVLTKQ